MTKRPGRFKIEAGFLDTPLPPGGGEGEVSKMVQVPEGEIFSPTTPALW